MSADQTAFRLDAAEEGGRVTVRFPPGTELNESTAEPFHAQLGALVAGRERPHLVIDLTGISVLTSTILTKLLALHRQVLGAGGALSVRNPTPTVREVFKITRLDTVLDVQAG